MTEPILSFETVRQILHMEPRHLMSLIRSGAMIASSDGKGSYRISPHSLSIYLKGCRLSPKPREAA